MSGGSFDYACFHAGDSDVFQYFEQFKAMERWLRENQRHDAADEVHAFILEVETAKRRLAKHGQRISDLLRAVEWTDSGDTSIEAVDIAYRELVGEDVK